MALVTDAFGGYGGIARYNRDFLTNVAALEDVERVDVFTRTAPAPVEALPPKIIFHRPVHGRVRYALRALLHGLLHRPDIIYNGHIYHSPLSARLARLWKAKLFSQLHGTEIWQKPAAHLLALLGQSDRVFCVSEHTRGRYLGHLGAGQDNSVVLHNTVRTEFSPGDSDAARSKFGLGEGQFAILTVGRLDTRGGGYKGHGRIIDALPALVAEGRDVVYLIAGTGDDRERLERLCAERGVADRVRFLGNVADEDLPDLYRAADLFALPSEGEGFGIVYLEAMACGTPAIGLDVGGAPEALGYGELGTVAAAADFPAALNEAVAHAAAMRDEDRRQLADRVRARFGHERFGKCLAQIWRSNA